MRHEMVGDTLLPLNAIAKLPVYANVYGEALKKYEGREGLCKKPIPLLGCEWLDVVFLSPIHPSLVFDEVLKAVKEVSPQDVELFQGFRQRWKFVDVSLNELDPTCIALYLPGEGCEEGVFAQFDGRMPDDFCVIPEEARALYREELREGGRPFYWARLWHVLYKGTISLAGKQFCPI